MKRKNTLGLVVIALIMCIFGCTNKDNVSNSANGPGVTMMAVDEVGNPVSNVMIDIIQDEQLIVALTTDKAGIASSSLDPGEYIYVIKSVPEDFILDKTEYPLTISNKMLTVGHLVTTVKAQVSLNGSGLVELEESGALFKITDESGKAVSGVSFGIYKDKEIITTVTTGESGEASCSLNPGEYIYVMISVPDGYDLDTIGYSLEINEGITKLDYIIK